VFKQIFLYLRLEQISKNFLLFTPLFFIDSSEIFLKFSLSVIPIIGFSLITQTLYLLNDLTDYKIDKKNKLKKKKNKKILFIYLISFFLITSFFLLFNKEILNKYLYLYIIIFFFYNFLLKKIFLLDLITLSSFYVIRICYGFEFYKDLKISIFFIIFTFSFFIILAILKRLIQIKKNNLIKKNTLIPYSKKNMKFIKKISSFFIVVNIIMFSTFILKNYLPTQILNDIIYSNNTFNIYQLVTITFFYLYVIFEIFKKTNYLIPNSDIMYLFLKNKIIISFVIIITVITVFK
jgi:4-hydroxybenzoate polyprenyltransferase